MTQIAVFVVLCLLLLVVLTPVIRRMLVLRFVRRASPQQLAEIGARGVAKTKDTITLTPVKPSTLDQFSMLSPLVDAFVAERFEVVDGFRIPQLANMGMVGLVRPADCLAAVVYDHPKAGVWCDVFCHHQDGTSLTVSNLRPTGLDPRPGHTSIKIPGTGPQQLVDRMTSEQPAIAHKVITRETFKEAFEHAYQDDVAWRKNRVTRPEEVAALARERFGKQ